MLWDSLDWVALVVGLCSCVGVRWVYGALHRIILFSVPKYQTLHYDKQQYVLKNLIKAVYLALLLCLAVPWVIRPIVLTNTWHSHYIRCFGTMYVSNDVVGLLFVVLPPTTRLHHLISTVLVCCALTIDFQSSEIGQAMFVYTVASATAYIVNLHLALRWLCVRHSLRWLRLIAGAIYLCCCTLAWSWHGWWIWHHWGQLSRYHCLYLGLLCLIIRDDLILMQWLVK